MTNQTELTCPAIHTLPPSISEKCGAYRILPQSFQMTDLSMTELCSKQICGIQRPPSTFLLPPRVRQKTILRVWNILATTQARRRLTSCHLLIIVSGTISQMKTPPDRAGRIAQAMTMTKESIHMAASLFQLWLIMLVLLPSVLVLVVVALVATRA